MVDEGYHVVIHPASYLLIHDVPYLTAQREIRRGTLVSSLVTAGDEVVKTPDTHVGMWVGEFPCDPEGRPLEQLRHSGAQQLDNDLAIDFSFSSKLHNGAGHEDYPDYYVKMTAYVGILENQAQAIDPGQTAKTFPVVRQMADESVFKYSDSGAARSGIFKVKQKLALDRVAIVGLGGSGSYVLDHVAKTPVCEIHLFDGDVFLTNNAYRAPGSVSVEELRHQPNKADFWRQRYIPLRDGLVSHPYFVDATNCAELAAMTFVFLCMDAGTSKQAVVEQLEAADVPFIDVGMGLYESGGSLGGTVRVTASLPGHRDTFRQRVSLAGAGEEDIYDRNIQIDDLNALNAVLAVIAWKKLFGFYHDFEHELNTTYTVEMHMLHREDHRET